MNFAQYVEGAERVPWWFWLILAGIGIGTFCLFFFFPPTGGSWSTDDDPPEWR